MLSGGDGILNKFSNSVNTRNKEAAKEQVKLKLAEYQTEYYDEMYFKKSISVNTKLGDWIAKNKTGLIETENYTFEITGSSEPYAVTIKKDNKLKKVIEGTITVDGELRWIPKGLEVGADVTYTPSGTYTEWTGAHSGKSSYNYILTSGTSYTGETGQTDMTISNWKVFKINESTGEVQLVPDGTKVTTPAVGLNGADGYNNAVKLLNEACSSLYGNGSIIKARSINIEDIEDVLDYEPENEYINPYTKVKYGKQYSNPATTYKGYPNIYAEEVDSVITPIPEGKNKTLKRSDAGSDWITGITSPGTSIQPYQTSYSLNNSEVSSKLNEGYSSILLPNTSSTNYWIASRCASVFSGYCGFFVFNMTNGDLHVGNVYYTNGVAREVASPLFPVVSLNAELISRDDTMGFIVE